MVELKVTQIDLAIHQDYHNMSHKPAVVDKRQKVLRERWEIRAQELAKMPGGVMVVFPASRALQLKTTENPLVRDERERIKKLGSLLGDRLHVPEGIDLLEDEYRSLFQFRNWILSDNINLWVYGEYYGSCVRGWGEIAQKALEIRDLNYRRVIELSRGAGDHYFDKRLTEGEVVKGVPLWNLD